MTKTRSFLLAAGLVLAMALTLSCTSDEGEKSETYQIYNASDMSLYKGNGTVSNITNHMNLGKVENGLLTLELPTVNVSDVKTWHCVSISEWLEIYGIEKADVEPQDAEVCILNGTDVDRGHDITLHHNYEQKIGKLMLTFDGGWVGFVYFSKDFSVKRVNEKGKKGWSKIYIGEYEITTDASIAKNGLRWVLYSKDDP